MKDEYFACRFFLSVFFWGFPAVLSLIGWHSHAFWFNLKISFVWTRPVASPRPKLACNCKPGGGVDNGIRNFLLFFFIFVQIFKRKQRVNSAAFRGFVPFVVGCVYPTGRVFRKSAPPGAPPFFGTEGRWWGGRDTL